MKRALLVLAMLLMAATSYNQTSRRTTNANGSATRSTENKTENQTRSTTTRTSVNNNQSEKQNQTRESNVATEQKRTNNNSATASGNQTRTINDNGNRQNYNGNENRNVENQNRSNNSGYVNNNNRNHSNNGYRESANNTHSTNKVYVNNTTSSRKYHYKHNANHSYKYTPYSRDYRAVHYVYREPAYVNIIWTRELHRHYIEMYPEVRYWNYNFGYSINSTSAYYADYYIGEVMNVYGQINDIFYAAETDEYFMYFGAYYPYHDFTVVIPGEIARRYSYRPTKFFMNQYINVTGLITTFDGKPEIVVKRNFQLDVY